MSSLNLVEARATLERTDAVIEVSDRGQFNQVRIH